MLSKVCPLFMFPLPGILLSINAGFLWIFSALMLVSSHAFCC
uniref:Uncharacterized protein n=1 Tax=Rhizophora mucronata TaxID=61149 RepID=A0A2P2QAU1_RHIMU